ncbi:MAG: zinc ribbon domain-containing protein [Candidatus Heimdallarchaeaceae archaeon]
MVIIIPRSWTYALADWIFKGFLYLWLLISPYLIVMGITFIIDVLINDPANFTDYLGFIIGPIIGGIIGSAILIYWMVSGIKSEGIKDAKFFNKTWLIILGIFGALLVANGIVDMIIYTLGAGPAGIIGGLLLQIPAIMRLIDYQLEKRGKPGIQIRKKEKVLPSFTPQSGEVFSTGEQTTQKTTQVARKTKKLKPMTKFWIRKSIELVVIGSIIFGAVFALNFYLGYVYRTPVFEHNYGIRGGTSTESFEVNTNYFSDENPTYIRIDTNYKVRIEIHYHGGAVQKMEISGFKLIKLKRDYYYFRVIAETTSFTTVSTVVYEVILTPVQALIIYSPMFIGLIWLIVSIIQTVRKIKKNRAPATIPSFSPEPAEEVQTDTIEQVIVQSKNTCGNCGNDNEADSKFCLNCGSEI